MSNFVASIGDVYKRQLPFCQDTGTAIIHGEKGQQVWTGYTDEEALSLGVYKTYTEENLRYSLASRTTKAIAPVGQVGRQSPRPSQ